VLKILQGTAILLVRDIDSIRLVVTITCTVVSTVTIVTATTRRSKEMMAGTVRYDRTVTISKA